MERTIEYDQGQIIVFDINRTWKSELFGKTTWFFRPTNRFELIQYIFQIEEMINPRLRLIVMDGVPNLLRDFQGREFKKYIVNSKIYAFILHALVNIALKNNITVMIGSYFSGGWNKSILFQEIINYYNLKIVEIM